MENDIFSEIKRIVDKNTNSSINQAMFSNGLTLGIITSSGLKLDNFKYEIPNYLILDYLKLSDSYSTENTTCSSAHNHKFNTPGPIKSLKSGDRVLVAQIGNECLVVGRVVANG